MLAWKTGLAVLSCCFLLGCSQAASPLAPEAPQFATYNSDEISYFVEIALGAEWGSADARVRRWEGQIQVQVLGAATAEDHATLRTVVEELNALLGPGRITLVEGRGNLEIRFAPVEQFPALEPNYVPGNDGFVWVGWNARQQIDRARILIASNRVTRLERSHLIREELTQALGLLQDSNRFPSSIFYAEWSQVTEYTPMDTTLIRMLYRPELRPGMSRSEAMKSLRRMVHAGGGSVS